MKIYFVLFRFALLSLATAVVDNVVFIGGLRRVGQNRSGADSGPAGGNVFQLRNGSKSRISFARAPPSDPARYALLVLLNGFVSYALLTFLHTRFGIDVIGSKVSGGINAVLRQLRTAAGFCLYAKAPAGN